MTTTQLERDKFEFHRDLVKKWDNTSTIGAFLFSIALTIALILSFIGIATIPEAVQIFMIGVIMFMLIFRYFKEITVGAITGKPGAGVRQYFYSGISYIVPMPAENMVKCPYCGKAFPPEATMQHLVKKNTSEPEIYLISCPNPDCDKYLGAVACCR